MRILFTKSLLSRSSYSTSFSSSYHYGIFISHYCTSPSFQRSINYPSRRHEEEARTIKVSVWWDFENCHVPADVNVFKVSQALSDAVRTVGIKGPIQITAFGDMMQLSRSNQEALSSTGVNLTHVPRGGKNSADRSLLLDLMCWVSQNPPPAHLFLVTGDRDFANILHRLRMNNYNILLASTDRAPSVLCSAASIMWKWTDLVKGENLLGKHFNQPPDGPYGSWYGQYMATLEDPFSIVEQPVCSQPDDLIDPIIESKPRPIPKIIIKQIRHILSSHPKGVTVSEFRSEMVKSNVCLDKDLYGYKKLYDFLLSMPRILSIQHRGDGQFLLRGIPSKAPLPSNEHNSDLSRWSKTNHDEGFTELANGKSSSSLPANVQDTKTMPGTTSTSKKVQHPLPPAENTVKADEKQTIKKVLPPPCPPTENTVKEVAKPSNGKVLKPPPPVEDTTKGDVKQTTKEGKQLLPVDENSSEVNKINDSGGEDSSNVEPNMADEASFLRRIWKIWFGVKGSGSEIKSCSDSDKLCTSGDSLENAHKALNNGSNSMDTSEKKKTIGISTELQTHAANLCPEICSSSAVTLEVHDGMNGRKASTNSGFFSWFLNWFKLETSHEPDIIETSTQLNSFGGKHEIFTQSSFWVDMEAFIHTPSGSVLISQSKSREEMAMNLQKEGPLVLTSISESDLRQLVDMLISEKKWVEECISQTFPFALSLSTDSHSSNESSTPFVAPCSQFDSSKLPESNQGKVVIDTKICTEKSKSELLADCEKLVHEILKDHPKGYNICSFRKLFAERYGYYLDIQRLGYQKLVSLLEKMPGVRMESSYMVPSGKTPKSCSSDGAFATSRGKNKVDESESSWEELGPVDDQGNSTVSKKKEVGHAANEYALPDDDDDFTDSDEEEAKLKLLPNNEESQLLNVLESWYGSEEGKRIVDHAVADGSKKSPIKQLSSTFAMKETSLARKEKPRRFSFVQDSAEKNDKKAVDDILISLQKSSESRKMQG